jgi:hypothetical protein
MLITPNHHEKMEWARMAQDAYAKNLNAIGHTYSAHAAMRTGEQLTIQQFDSLQDHYRAWLIRGFSPAALATSVVDVSTVTEYGLTQKLSNPIRCF